MLFAHFFDTLSINQSISGVQQKAIITHAGGLPSKERVGAEAGVSLAGGRERGVQAPEQRRRVVVAIVGASWGRGRRRPPGVVAGPDRGVG